MRIRKSRPNDETLIHDERQDWAERSSALSRLVADGRTDLESVARQWLHGDDPDLAIEALSKLLTFWRESPHIHDYVTIAVQWLTTAEDPDTRASAAGFLGGFLTWKEQFLDEILFALLKALEQDDDPFVQQMCYQELLRRVAPQEAPKTRTPRERPFDRNTDVRWDLLEPLRRRFAR